MKNLSPINDNKDVVTKEYVDPIKSQAALNRTTLGTQCKNLLKNNAATKTVNGVTFTVNSDGSITAKQTTTAPGNATIDVATNITLNPGTYILTGDDEIKKSGYGEIRFYINGTIYAANTAHTFDEEVTISAVRIFVWSGVNINGSKTIYPMLRLADITDDTYEPYQPSVREQIIGTYFPTTQEKGLANNTDLNTITEIGNYVCYTGSSAATMINCPTKTGGFRLIVTNLIVSSNDNSTIRYQWIIPNNLNDVLCFRRRIDMSTDTFSNWYSFKSYQPGLQEQIPYSISVPGKSTSAAISYSGVPTLICLTPNTADSTAGGLYMINSAGTVVKLIEKSGVVVAANATSKTFTITNNTSTVMDVCVSRCWRR